MTPHCDITSKEYKELYSPTCFAVPLVLIGTQECPTEDDVDALMVGMNGDTSCPTQCNQNDQCVKSNNTVVYYDFDYMGTGGATQVNLYAEAGPGVEGRVPNPLGSSTCFLVKDCCCVETQQGTQCVTIPYNRVFQLTRYAASDVLCIGALE